MINLCLLHQHTYSFCSSSSSKALTIHNNLGRFRVSNLIDRNYWSHYHPLQFKLVLLWNHLKYYFNFSFTFWWPATLGRAARPLPVDRFIPTKCLFCPKLIVKLFYNEINNILGQNTFISLFKIYEAKHHQKTNQTVVLLALPYLW